MSSYLVNRIRSLANVEVVTQASITGLEGRNNLLEAIRWRQQGGAEVRRAIHHLFLFIGADPNSGWLKAAGVPLDDRGFVLTGGSDPRRRILETRRAGIFAVGDIRSGSVKRVAAAVGDGAQVVANVHDYLAPPELAGLPSAGLPVS